MTETGVSTPESDDRAARIAELWSDEHCDWNLTYDAAFCNANDAWWLLELTWSTDHDGNHQADWMTYTWQFYGNSPDDCMKSALDWLEPLAAWAQAVDHE